MPIRLVVFDMAGTTINDGDAVTDAFVYAFAKQNIVANKDRVRLLMGYKKTLAIDIVLRELGVVPTEPLVNAIHDDFEKEMLLFYTSSLDLMPMLSTENVFATLRNNGVKVALNTGFPKTIADAIVDRFKWSDKIDAYIASDEVELGRPDPAMIKTLMQRTQVENAAEVMKVGDTEVDIREGKNAGCGVVVAVTTGAFTRQQLEPYNPDIIIDDLSELPHIIK